MKPTLYSVLIAFLCLPIFAQQTKAPSTKNTPKAISFAPMLGVGFGEIIEIEGKLIDDRDTRRKAHLGKKLLEVHKVNGKRLSAKKMIELNTFSFSEVKLPQRGTHTKLRGYETGGFSGIPNEAFNDIPPVGTTNFHFKRHFMVTKKL